MNTPPVASIPPVNAIISVADPRQDTAQRLANIAVGQQVQGKVLSRLSDGTHLVDIQNTQARIDLPANIKAGDTLFMTLIRNDPRPTFLLTQNASQSAATLPQGTPTPAAAVVPNPNAGVTTTLSSAAKLVESLTQHPSQSQAQTTTTASSALIPSGQPVQTNALTTALHNAVQFSGLFYEAHVAQWALGKRSLADIQQEPQSKFSSKAAAAIFQSNDVAETEQGKLIQSQLSTLEQQKFIWQGEVWTGQTMQWEVKRDQEQASQQEEGNTKDEHWQSTATFKFEHLGNVSATLHLTGNQLSIQIDTDQVTSKNAMIEHQTVLQKNLDNSGIALTQLKVDVHD